MRQTLDTLSPIGTKRFLHHYNFPPYSTGEVKRMGSAGRREIGHGALAERAIEPVIPSEEDFPYTIRLVSEVLSSNGSTSMASVCGSTLALMDAGVPVSSPVAGIAMGLVIGGNGRHAVLTDIQGLEDHLGDMDFKVAGTADGITALQMDIKIAGVTREIMRQALYQARDGRLHILEKMAESLETPREQIAEHAPRILILKIRPDKIRDLIGPGGKMIRSIVEETGVKIDVEDDGTVSIASSDGDSMDRAISKVEAVTADAEIGKLYTGTVKKVVDFGAFVEILPGKEGLVHISQLAPERVRQVTDIVDEGDEITVKVLEIDRQGKIRLSRREALAEQAAAR
jgi:polyribonucleotide nucleotidyltransferase